MPAAAPESLTSFERTLSALGAGAIRYGLALVIAWIGALKYTGSEAARIQLYIQHSPLMSWTDHLLTARALSDTFGTIEITAAVLIVAGRWLPRLSVLGSVAAVGLFLSTLSFMATTPGIGDAGAGGFPALSPTGQFLLKDIVLLGASVCTLAESISGSRRSSTDPVAPISALA